MRTEAQRRHQLLNRIRRHYEVTVSDVQLGELRFAFTRVSDPDVVLDQVAQQVDLQERLHGRNAPNQPLHLPYWAELWDSASGIGEYLTKTPLMFSASHGGVRRVLDLGCGMGMAGTVAAALGAYVCFADLEPPALLFARLNSLPWRSRIQTRQLDWQRDRLGSRFDLIIGADILYEKAQWEFLEPFWRAHLADGGTVLLGEPGRATGELFIDWIQQRGWTLQITEQLVSTRPTPIRLLIARPVPTKQGPLARTP